MIECVFVSAGDRGILLVAWLNELVYLSQTRGAVCVGFELEVRQTEAGFSARVVLDV